MSYVFSRFEQLKASGALPTASGVALEILRLSQREDATVAQLVHLLQGDPALAGRLVKFANSTQAGAGRPVVAVGDAVKRLGFAVVRQLSLGFSVLDSNRGGHCAGFDYPRFWSRSLATALAAQAFCLRMRTLAPEEGFACGLLSDIGSLALASLYPERYAEVLGTGSTGSGLSAAEREAFGTDHLEFAAALLEDWRLPRICVDAVFHGERPDQSGFAAGSRAQVLCEVVALSRTVGEYFVSDLDARRRITPGMLLAAARMGVDAEALAGLCDAVAEAWQSWGRLLGIEAGAVPRLDLQEAGEPAQPPAPERAAARVVGLHGDDLPDGSSGTWVAPGPARDGLVIHLVSDDRFSGGRLRELLVAAGHALTSFPTADAALAAALEAAPDMLVIDLDGDPGQALCAALRSTTLGERVYVLCTYVPDADAQCVADVFDAPDHPPVGSPDIGPDDFLAKPIDRVALELRIRAARRLRALREALRREQDGLRRLAADLATANRRLQRTALVDAATGLPNRRYAFGRLEQEWTVATQSRRPLSCLAVEIDHVPQVGGAHGLASGDALVSEIAAVLRDSVRTNDVVCRLGNTEFLVICPDADRTASLAAASRLRAAVEQRLGSARVGVRPPMPALTVSVGAATRDGSVPDAESLLRLAEGALHAAVAGGGNRVVTERVQVAPVPGATREPAPG